MKSTLERELKVREIVEREALEVSHAAQDSAWLLLGVFPGKQVSIGLDRRRSIVGMWRPRACYSLLLDTTI